MKKNLFLQLLTLTAFFLFGKLPAQEFQMQADINYYLLNKLESDSIAQDIKQVGVKFILTADKLNLWQLSLSGGLSGHVGELPPSLRDSLLGSAADLQGNILGAYAGLSMAGTPFTRGTLRPKFGAEGRVFFPIGVSEIKEGLNLKAQKLMLLGGTFAIEIHGTPPNCGKKARWGWAFAEIGVGFGKVIGDTHLSLADSMMSTSYERTYKSIFLRVHFIPISARTN